MVGSVACYGCEVWLLKREEQRKLLALEMDYLRRSAKSVQVPKNPKHRHQERNKENYQFQKRTKEVSQSVQITKKLLGKAMAQTVACYGCESWLLKTEEQRKLLALETD